ncbi:MAG: LamG domain-containing protein [Pedosphaera sp.]|nr:LamG domain-containing protein [Pedosphaera sp.]
MLNAQPAGLTTHRALQLDGDGSYVELPANLLANVNEVTVEGWLNWASFQNASRFFDFGAGPFLINVQNRSTTSTLWFESPKGNIYEAVSLPGILLPNQWFHIAAVRSAAGLQLMVNGTLLMTVPEANQVDSTQGKENFLGHSNFRTQLADADFRGRMAEVRIWSAARTEAQVRMNLAAKLTGKEPGLLALYNFIDAAQPGRDATGHGHDGKMMGNARVVNEQISIRAVEELQEKVLQLDGTTGFVELPPAIFNGLEEATVEAWVKWDRLGGTGWNRLFTYGAATHDLSIATQGDTSLWFIISDAAQGFHQIVTPGVLRAREWVHVAAVSGKGGMRLLLNGVTVGTNDYTGSFAALKNGDLNRVGKTVTPNELDPPM